MEEARGPTVEINTSKTTRPLCLSSCLVILGGYRTNGLFQVISRAASPFLPREGPSLPRSALLSSLLAQFLRVAISRTHAGRCFFSFFPIDDCRVLDGHILNQPVDIFSTIYFHIVRLAVNSRERCSRRRRG